MEMEKIHINCCKSSVVIEKFDKYKDGFVTALWEINPGWASGVGYHKFDNLLVVPNAAEEKKQLDFENAQLDSLKQFKLEDLSDNNKTDFQMIKNGSDWSSDDDDEKTEENTYILLLGGIMELFDNL